MRHVPYVMIHVTVKGYSKCGKLIGKCICSSIYGHIIDNLNSDFGESLVLNHEDVELKEYNNMSTIVNMKDD